jgi:hypothetical protein
MLGSSWADIRLAGVFEITGQVTGLSADKVFFSTASTSPV